MKMTVLKRRLSLILCVVFIAAVTLFTSGCNDKKNSSGDSQSAVSEVQYSVSEGQASASDTKVLGEGATKFYFTVTDMDGGETKFEINTDKTTVGDALVELGLISGDEGEYGLYVKKVNGITADYDKDGTYWAFYVDGEYATTGVDSTEVKAGAAYAFKQEK